MIDPRRDCDIYLDIAQEHGLDNAHPRDALQRGLCGGSRELVSLTGASILHGDMLRIRTDHI